tara:strand:- start:68 stop:346 length:279 start_codon:yes stop_codon:yes gene_type:complete
MSVVKTKTAAAKALGITRQTIHRYLARGLISEDSRGNLNLDDIQKVWHGCPPSKPTTPRREFIPGRKALHDTSRQNQWSIKQRERIKDEEAA